jgi:hypothetical protein
MKRILSLTALFAFAITLTILNTDTMVAQNKNTTKGFVDANGDGYNDNAKDDDGDGIPNNHDDDYTGTRQSTNGRGFVDANGDGINDNAPDHDGDGIPNGQDPDFVKGTGAGSPAGKALRGGSGDGTGTGTGDCDGTGPKGKGRRGK